MKEISRRSVLVGAAGMAFPAPARSSPSIPSGGVLAFRIRRKDSIIGTHRLEFARADEILTVQIAVDIAVKFGPLVLYRYTHRNLEQWQGGTLMRMTAETNDDGTRAYARLRREDGQLVVEGSKSGRYVAPEGALAATHWNVAELSGPMINPQNGELLRPRVANRGETALATDAATPVRATHYALSGDVALDLWYDMDLTWQALAFSGSDGSLVRYERLS